MSDSKLEREMEEIERVARASKPEPGKVYPRASTGEHLRKRAARRAENKRQLTVRFDQDLIESYRELAGEGSYQRLMNRALREWLSRSELGASLRRVLREELARTVSQSDDEPVEPNEESGAA